MGIYMKVETPYIVFSSGRKAYVHLGIVGLSASDTLLMNDSADIFYGWDGTINGTDQPRKNELQSEDLRELADHMIARWQAYKEKLK